MIDILELIKERDKLKLENVALKQAMYKLVIENERLQKKEEAVAV